MKEMISVATTLMNESRQRLVSDACTDLGYGCANYSSEDELLSGMGRLPPDILLMDLDADGPRSLILQDRLRNAFDPICVIYLVERPEIETVVTALRRGATGIVPAPWNVDELSLAMQASAQLQVARATWIHEARDAQRRTNELSARQRDVMVRLLAGQSNKMIARQLYISQRTVEKHRRQMHRATGTTTPVELLRLYFAAERPLTAAYSLNLDDLSTLLRLPHVQPPTVTDRRY